MTRIALATLVLIAFAAVLRAETILVVFTDPPRCPPCRRLEKALAHPAVQSLLGDCGIRLVAETNPRRMAAWRVPAIPTAVLVDVTDGRTTELRRFTGARSAWELIRFVRGK